MDAGIILQVADGLPPISGSSGFFGIGKVTTETVTAIDGAGAGRHQQCASSVFMQNTCRAPGHQITDSIDTEARCQDILFGHRQNLPQQGVVDIAMAHFCGETAWNPKREGIPGLCGNTVGKSRQTEYFQQFQRVA